MGLAVRMGNPDEGKQSLTDPAEDRPPGGNGSPLHSLDQDAHGTAIPHESLPIERLLSGCLTKQPETLCATSYDGEQPVILILTAVPPYADLGRHGPYRTDTYRGCSS